MKTRVNINITTGYHVLSSGSAVNLFLSRYLEKKQKQKKTTKKKTRKKDQAQNAAAARRIPSLRLSVLKRHLHIVRKLPFKIFVALKRKDKPF